MSEQRVREALQRRAERVRVDADVLDRVLEPGRQRVRPGAVLGAVAAVLALVVGAGVLSAVLGADQPAPSTQGPAGAVDDADPAEAPATPAGWRTEYWGAVAVDVPGDWALVTGLFEASNDIGLCPSEVRDAGGRRIESAPAGYVGREDPALGTCRGANPHEGTSTPYVWFVPRALEAFVPVMRGDPEVVELDGVLVAVSAPGAVRERIVASVRRQTICATRYQQPPSDRLASTEGLSGEILESVVCAYRPGAPSAEGRRYYELVGAVRREGEESGRRIVEALSVSPSRARPEHGCGGLLPDELVVLAVTGRDRFGSPDSEITQRSVLRFGGCLGGSGDDDRVRGLDEESIEAWWTPSLGMALQAEGLAAELREKYFLRAQD